MSDSVRPHRWQPTRLPHPWDSPGKNTGVGCHFLLQCMKVKSQSEVTQSCLTLSDPMDCSPPGSSVHGIFQARVLEWGATAFSILETRIPQICNSSHPLWNQKVQPKCEWEARRDRHRETEPGNEGAEHTDGWGPVTAAPPHPPHRVRGSATKCHHLSLPLLQLYTKLPLYKWSYNYVAEKARNLQMHSTRDQEKRSQPTKARPSREYFVLNS